MLSRALRFACLVAVLAFASTAAADDAPDAGASAAASDNHERPALASDDLATRAAHLLDALVQGKPELADDFFFPREPFLPLKDVADPGRYHAQLLAAYHRDVREMARKRRSWEGARFVSFELGTPPTWVAPGKEWNKIGYHRSFHGKLRYELDGRTHTLDVHTVISWAGGWYVTHLGAFKKKS